MRVHWNWCTYSTLYECACVQHFNAFLTGFLSLYWPVDRPQTVIPLLNITLPQGSSHMFVCAAVADPQPVFVFRFNGERITSSRSNHTLFTNNTHGTLSVLNIKGSDGGTYSCSASNRRGSVSTSAVLSVQGVHVCVCVCALAHVCAHVRVCVYMCEYVRVCIYVHVCALTARDFH